MTRWAYLALALMLTSCAASSSTPSEQQSTAGHIVSTTAGSHGSVFFVSDRVGWVFSIPPDSQRTVIYRTGDGGASWRLWGIAPIVDRVLGVSVADVVLIGAQCPSQCEFGVLRSGDGTHWSFLPAPNESPFFLPDLRHGLVFGFMPEPVCDTCVPAKGGPPGPPPPSAVWATADGGVTWKMVMKGNFGDSGGTISFWTPTDGILTQRPGGGTAQTVQLTHDGGLTWHPLTFTFPPPMSPQAFVADSQLVMFDQSRGLLALRAADYHPQTVLYISRTGDGGRTWSAPEAPASCAPCGGELYFMDARRWLASDKGLFITSDAGVTWRPVATTITAKDTSAVEVVRSTPGMVVVLEPGVVASMTTDWGAHWRPVGLPQIYQSYRGLNGAGGWPFCCV